MPLSDGTPRTRITEDQMILSVDWGEIQGDIDNQVDLINMFDTKADKDHTHLLSELTDVDVVTSPPQDGYALIYADNVWKPSQIQAGGGGATALSELTDVSLNNLIVNDILTWNSEKWFNQHGVIEDSIVIVKAAYTNDPNDDITIRWPGENKTVVNIMGEDTEIYFDSNKFLYMFDGYLNGYIPAEVVQPIIEKLQIPIEINYNNMIYDENEGGYVLPTTETPITVPWDTSNIQLTGDIEYDGYYSDSLITDIYMDPLGKKLYILENAKSVIQQYNLETPFDVTTAIYEDLVVYSSYYSYESALSMMFAKNGQYLILLFDDYIESITNPLTMPWDIPQLDTDYYTSFIFDIPEIYQTYGDSPLKINTYDGRYTFFYHIMGSYGIYVYYNGGPNSDHISFYDKTINFTDFGISNPTDMYINYRDIFIYCKDNHSVYHLKTNDEYALENPTLIEIIDVGISTDVIHFRPDGYGFIASWKDDNNIVHLRSYIFGNPHIVSGYIEVVIPSTYFGVIENYSTFYLQIDYNATEYTDMYPLLFINEKEFLGTYFDSWLGLVCSFPKIKKLNSIIGINDIIKIRFNVVSYKSSVAPVPLSHVNVIINSPTSFYDNSPLD